MSFNSNIVDGIVEIACSHFFRKQGDERFYCCFSSVICWALNSLYLRLTRQKEILSIEEIEQNKKQNYWKISAEFEGNAAGSDRKEVTKAIYILDLITKTN